MGVFLLLETFADSFTAVKDPNTLKTAHLLSALDSKHIKS